MGIKNLRIIVVVVSLFFCTLWLNARPIAYSDVASTVILNSLETQPPKSFLKQLYTRLFFVPVWMYENRPSPATQILFSHIKNDITLNKSGQLYLDTLRLEGRVEDVYRFHGRLVEKIDLEFKVSQLYKAYSDYAYLGSINWGAFQARISNLIVNGVSTEWVLHRPAFDAIDTLEKVALGGELDSLLESATPTQYHYRALQKSVALYRSIKEQGGWQKITLNGTLKLGDRDLGVMALRERLRMTKDDEGCDDSVEDEAFYGACLERAVRHFQKRNGLGVDGAVGPATLRALNISVEQRLKTLLLNLDRIKWFRQIDAPRHIVVNIPDFMLYFEENGMLIQTIRTVVGKPKNPTPIFSNEVKTVVLNPQWNVPKSIIQKEMIPKLLRNSRAMDKENIEIYSGWGKDATLVNPATVNWSKYRHSKRVPYRFAQKSGRHNALGKVKFLFPNKFSVYMHDTPSKHLFSRNKRAFSHGCIRLQKPRELLETFSTFNDNIDFETSQEILKGKKKKYYSLEQRVPVDIIYLTAWVDYEGQLQFRNDVYGYDAMQLKSFRKW